mgnify:CR=1 FL=1
MGEKKEPHYHKYIRKRFKSGYTIYKCTTCNHYIHENLLVGREALCWRCGKVFDEERNNKVNKL